MKTDKKLKTWCAGGGGGITERVPVAFRNKCERVTGPQPERVRSICVGVNHRGIRHRVLTNQRDRSYVYAAVSLAAGGRFVGGCIVTYIFSRVSVGSACVYGKGTVTSHIWLNIA